MSLTNPYALVNEERLAEFYQTISPYLGGMPDILANKFAKGDMHSTDEKMIGQWTDGKPLYQKTVTGTTNFDGSTAMASFDSTFNIVDMKAYIVSAENSRQYNPFWYSVNNYWCMRIENNKLIGTGTTAYYNNKDFVATICYTKTTDSVVYIGEDTDYSTDEKIVGTWIDGKPLYQKTIPNITFPSGALNDVTIYDPTALNVETPLEIKATTANGGTIPYQSTIYAGVSYGVGLKFAADKVLISTDVDRSSLYGNITITIRYTKTTD